MAAWGGRGVCSMSVVLVVEDEALILILAESVLNNAGYETLSASSLSEALAIIEDPKQKFDLLCADLGLQEHSEDGLKIALR